MPKIYLSPSTQDWNMYVTGSGSEEYNMNLLADALVPYLLSNGIQYQRNRPEMTAGSSIREANQGEYDLYLALHSNAAPEGRYGEERGIIAFYYPGSVGGQRAAELIAQELRKIYPLPNKVTTRPTTSLGEVRQPRFPSVLLEIGYHDNYSDATWLEGHWDAIAQQIARGLTEYFGPHIYGAQRDYKTFSKKMVIERLLRENSLPGEALLGFGDGYVEIEDVKAAGGFACGVASNEKTRQGVDEWKRQRLIRAGADIIIPDYRRLDELEAFLFEKEAQ